MEEDAYKFSHAGSEVVGCSTGVHMYDTSEGSPSGPRMVADGDLTAMVLTCIRCGAKHTISSPLGMNADIEKAQTIDASRGVYPVESVRPPMRYPSQQQQAPTVTNESASDNEVLKKLFG